MKRVPLRIVRVPVHNSEERTEYMSVAVYANETLKYLKASVFFLPRFSLSFSLVCVSEYVYVSAKTDYMSIVQYYTR